MKKAKTFRKIIAILLVITFCMPFVFSCGKKEDNSAAKAEENPVTEAPVTEAPPTDPPPPTEPPTEKPTDPPTERPTDPANLPAPDVIGKSETSDGYEIIPGARYYLWSPNSNLYLTVDGDYNYAGFTQEEFTGDANQMFVFEKIREEVTDTSTKIYYRMKALGTKDRYVDTEEADGKTDGKLALASTLDKLEGAGSEELILKVQKKTAIKDDVTKETIEDFADVNLPLFSVGNALSKGSKVLDVSGVSKSPGGTIHFWGGGTANNQKWFFELVSDVESGKIIPRGKQELKY